MDPAIKQVVHQGVGPEEDTIVRQRQGVGPEEDTIVRQHQGVGPEDTIIIGPKAEQPDKPDPWGDTLDELAPHRGVRVSSTEPERSKKMIRNALKRRRQGRISHDQMLNVEERADRVALEEMGHKAFRAGLLKGLVKE